MYDGSPEERKQLQRDFVEKGTFNVLITHYDLVMRDKAALKKVCDLRPCPAACDMHDGVLQPCPAACDALRQLHIVH